jgi:hypothetical protein
VSLLTGKRLQASPPESGGSPFLSLEDSSTLALPLRVHALRERESVRGILQKIHGEWLAAWSDAVVSGGIDSTVRMEDATPVRPENGGDDPMSWMYCLLFGGSAAEVEIGEKGPIALGVAQRAWEAWLSSIYRSIGRPLAVQGGSSAAVPVREAPPWPWAGGLDAVFSFGSIEWRLQLSAAEVEFVLGSARIELGPAPSLFCGALVPLTDALSQCELTVNVELQPLVLSLGQLQSLAVGDIVVLSHPLDMPAQLNVDAGEMIVPTGEAQPEPLCQAWLGKSDGNMAVELHPNP